MRRFLVIVVLVGAGVVIPLARAGADEPSWRHDPKQIGAFLAATRQVESGNNYTALYKGEPPDRAASVRSVSPACAAEL